MCFLSRDLAQTCSDTKVARARSFLKQRQEEAHLVADRLGLARRTCEELRRWFTDIEAEECQSQSQNRRLEADLMDILPTFGYDFDLDVQVPGNVVPLNKPGK